MVSPFEQAAVATWFNWAGLTSARVEHLQSWEKNQVRPEVVRKQSAFALTIKFISFSVAFAVSSFRRATLGPDDWLLSETDQNRGIGRPG